jgi:hypothetical protein
MLVFEAFAFARCVAQDLPTARQLTKGGLAMSSAWQGVAAAVAAYKMVLMPWSLTYLLLSWPVSVGETFWTKLLSACGALSLIFNCFLTALQQTEACSKVWSRKVQLQTQSSSDLVTCCACLAAIDPSSLQSRTVSARRPTKCC